MHVSFKYVGIEAIGISRNLSDSYVSKAEGCCVGYGVQGAHGGMAAGKTYNNA